MIYWQLIYVYLKIGLFGFGGGYAMLSLIQFEIVDRHHKAIYGYCRYFTDDSWAYRDK